MAPDLNSLPPSRSISCSGPTTMSRTLPGSGSGRSPSPSPRSTSLVAAASVNAGLQQEGTRRPSNSSMTRNQQASQSTRRRSTVLLNLQLNDPTIPSPGEMISEGQMAGYRTSSPHSLVGSPIMSGGDLRHSRAPSLGELHQELENEQEAQVNRLLQMIRTQQQQLQQLQATPGAAHNPPAIDESTPTSERSMSFSNPSLPQIPHLPQSAISTPRSPSALHPRSSFDLARADLHQRRSRTPSRQTSPRLRADSVSADAGEPWNLGGRDESAFYQAETQMMVRENQMLRQRIRELERQVTELNANSAITHEPAMASHLIRSQAVSEASQNPTEIPATVSTSRATEEAKD